MRARTHRTFAILFLFLLAAFPSVAFGEDLPDPFIHTIRFLGLPLNATALRAGDQVYFQVQVHSKYDLPTVTADLSALGQTASTSLTTFQGYGAPYYPSYFHDFSWFTVSSDTPDGVKTIPVTATNSLGSTAATSTQIIVDNQPPTLSLSSVSFSDSPPVNGSTMYVSGKASGTGSAFTAYVINLRLSDSNGQPLYPVWSGYGTEENRNAVTSAVAASPDGTFRVPIELFASDEDLARAATLELYMTGYDAAGNTASSTISVAIPHTSRVSSVLFIPGTEASRLYYRDALGIEHQAWEPDLYSDIPHLAMNADGTSKEDVYTKDLIGTFWGNNPALALTASQLFNSDVEVYSEFERYMDSLVASTTFGMNEWRPYPYDWRYGVESVVNDGTLTKTLGGSIERVYLENLVDEMASSSATGKVTIVAHSNGGLIAKALLQKLQEEDKAGLVDKLVMVGTPQWGTPSAIGSLLHGDSFTQFPWLVVNHATARAEEADMMDPYDLLPSAAYFEHVLDPVTTFSSVGSPSSDYASAYGSSISTPSALAQFLENTAKLDRTVGGATDLNVPLPLRPDLIDTAANDHATLDSWVPPPGVSVFAIAGWGQETVSGYQYTSASKTVCTMLSLFQKGCADAPTLRRTPLLTQDGDGTVVSPSALGNSLSTYYFNSTGYAKAAITNFNHQNLASAPPVQEVFTSLLEGIEVRPNDYITSISPTSELGTLTVVSSHSPVNLLVTDSNGNKSGVVPLSGSDFAGIVEQIPGSFVSLMDDEEYVYLPESGTYQVVATGYASGPASIELGTATGEGVITTKQAFTSLPIATSTEIVLSVNGATATTSSVSIDEDGDGTPDLSVTPAGTTTAFNPSGPLGYIAHMKQAIAGMELSPVVERQLDAKLSNVEHLLRRDNKWDSRDDDRPLKKIVKLLFGRLLDNRIDQKLGQIEQYVHRQESKPGRGRGNAQKGIPNAEGAQIIDMLTELRSLTSNL